jgi:hypothetical protein
VCYGKIENNGKNKQEHVQPTGFIVKKQAHQKKEIISERNIPISQRENKKHNCKINPEC